jgi:hypothetical protein
VWALANAVFVLFCPAVSWCCAFHWGTATYSWSDDLLSRFQISRHGLAAQAYFQCVCPRFRYIHRWAKLSRHLISLFFNMSSRCLYMSIRVPVLYSSVRQSRLWLPYHIAVKFCMVKGRN